MQRRESRHYVVSDAQYATASGERVLNRHNQTSFVHESISQKKKYNFRFKNKQFIPIISIQMGAWMQCRTTPNKNESEVSTHTTVCNRIRVSMIFIERINAFTAICQLALMHRIY